MERDVRPGPKPKRLYLRTVRFAQASPESRPPPRRLREFLSNLERVGRLVAHGELTDPSGDLLVFRAADRAEATRILRADPLRELPESTYAIEAWNPTATGSGVNLDPPPARGSGRLTSLDRVAVVVRDQAAASAWYRDVLGLSIRSDESEGGLLELSLGKGAAALSLVAPQRSWGEPVYSETLARVGAPTGIAFRTDSAAALELRLRHAGARITQPTRTEPWGELSLRFSDPDGNEFMAYQRNSSRRESGRTPADAEPPEGAEGPTDRPSTRTPARRRA